MISFQAFLNNEFSLKEVLKAVPSLTANLLSAFLGKKWSSSPTFLTWVLSNRCQLTCRHCSRELFSEPLSLDKKKEIAKNIASSSTCWVSFTGGEPLMVPGVMDIIRIIKNGNKKVTITTNGAMLKSFMGDIVGAGIDAVNISVDSHQSQVHDYLRGASGLFNNIFGAIEELKKNRIFKKPQIKLKCTISRANYKELINYVDFWKDKVDSIYFQPIVNNNMNQIRDKNLLFAKEDEKTFRSVLSNLQKKYSSFKNDYYNFMPDYIFHKEELYRKLKYKCLIISTSALYILPHGKAVICYGERGEIAADTAVKSIADIWRSDKTRAVQKKIRFILESRYDPNCFCWEANTLFNLHLLSLYNFVSKIKK
jgi:MoaA/NifB/PqqE/SkfB family radical SAM enzyme